MTPIRRPSGRGWTAIAPSSRSHCARCTSICPDRRRAILDCGGGPGRYAIELARQGYEVVLFDLSAGNLALAREKAAEAGVALTFVQGTALDLSRFADGEFDAVLLMGPLYHLLEESERRQALAEAYRVLRPGGPLFAAFIGRYAAHRDCAAGYPDLFLGQRDEYDRILADGKLPPRDDGRVAFVAYFAHPAEVAPVCWASGFEVATVLGVEGVVSAEEDEINKLNGPAWDAWLGCELAGRVRSVHPRRGRASAGGGAQASLARGSEADRSPPR